MSEVALVRVGYWRSPEEPHWPDPAVFVDENWESDERHEVASYLSRGFVARAYLGRSTCRICGAAVGALELSDGTYVWPEGLSHYVHAHSVRLPRRLVDHVQARARALGDAEVDEAWWRTVS